MAGQVFDHEHRAGFSSLAVHRASSGSWGVSGRGGIVSAALDGEKDVQAEGVRSALPANSMSPDYNSGLARVRHAMVLCPWGQVVMVPCVDHMWII